jgi:hypothetical protein
MVGTTLDGQLNRLVVPPRSRPRFAVATREHDAAIRRLLRENPMRGAISISLEREPDYFVGANIGGASDQTIVAFDDERLVCMGRCTTRNAWINGQVRRTGYLAELRLDASVRGRFDLVRDGYRFFRTLQESDPADVYFTSIAADNERARRLLERGLPGLPRYTHIGDLTTLLISTRRSLPDSISWGRDAPVAEFKSRIRGTAGAPRPNQRSALNLGTASAAELAEFFNSAGSRNHFATVWSAAAIESLARHDLPNESFGVIRNGREIIAAAGLWDQRRFRQTIVRAYSPALTCARPLINLTGKLFGIPPLPRAGGVLSHAFLSPLAIRAGHEALFIDLVAAFRRRAAARGIDYLTLALPSADSRLAALKRRFRCRAYSSRIYRVQWPGRFEFPLDAGAILPEVALL